MGADRGIHIEVPDAQMALLQPLHVSVHLFILIYSSHSFILIHLFVPFIHPFFHSHFLNDSGHIEVKLKLHFCNLPI